MARRSRTNGITTAVAAIGLLACAGAGWSAWPWSASFAGPNVTRIQTPTEHVSQNRKIVLYLNSGTDTGATWRLDRDLNTGLDLVAIEDLVPSARANRGSATMVPPRTQRYLVTGKHPGTARLVFTYRRVHDDGAPPVQQTYLIEVLP